MKTILEFNLPEDLEEWDKHKNAMALKVAVCDFQQKLRQLDRYTDQETIEINKLREMFYEYVGEFI